MYVGTMSMCVHIYVHLDCSYARASYVCYRVSISLWFFSSYGHALEPPESCDTQMDTIEATQSYHKFGLLLVNALEHFFPVFYVRLSICPFGIWDYQVCWCLGH